MNILDLAVIMLGSVCARHKPYVTQLLTQFTLKTSEHLCAPLKTAGKINCSLVHSHC